MSIKRKTVCGKIFSLLFLTGFSLVSGLASASFIEDFNDGSAQGWTLEGLWHVTGNSPNGTQALGYVQDETTGTILNGNYNTAGERNSGTATTPTLTCGSSCLLSFDWLDQSEGSSFDILSLQIILPSEEVTLFSTQGVSTTSDYARYSEDLLSLVAPGGAFQLQFLFDTVDSIANDTAGARIDNILLETGPVASVPEPSPLLLLMGSLVGLIVSRCYQKCQSAPSTRGSTGS
jgi:hypothetical protein